MNEQLQRIGKLLRTQDNLATSDPMFLVQQRVRFYGVALEYTDDHVWIKDGEEADRLEAARLDVLEFGGGDLGGWVKVGYVDRWEFVTACFTQRGADDYIAANGHNLNEPRIYVASADRNAEFIAVRKFLLEQGKCDQTKPS